MKTLLKTLALVVTLAVGWTAAAQDSPAAGDDTTDPGATTNSPVPFPFEENEEEFERAKLLLSSYHGTPPKRSFEDNLAHAQAILWTIAMSEESASNHRKAALEALGHWPDEMVRELYVRLLRDEDTPEHIRHRLMLLLADHFEDSALAELEAYLSHDDLQLRLSAIEAIARLPSDAALDTLRKAATDEPHPVARKRLEEFSRTLR